MSSQGSTWFLWSVQHIREKAKKSRGNRHGRGPPPTQEINIVYPWNKKKIGDKKEHRKKKCGEVKKQHLEADNKQIENEMKKITNLSQKF